MLQVCDCLQYIMQSIFMIISHSFINVKHVEEKAIVRQFLRLLFPLKP